MARNKYDVDEIYEEHFDLGQLKRLGRYVIPYKKDMIIAAVLMLSSSAATMPSLLRLPLPKCTWTRIPGKTVQPSGIP